jgi:monoamine oxidase
VFVAGGHRTTYDGLVPPDPAVTELLGAIAELERLAAGVPVAHPWRAAAAADLDSETVESWKRRTLTSAAARGVLDTICQSLGWEPREASLLFAAFMVAGAGDEHTRGTVARIVAVGGGAQERRFRGGSQQLALHAAQRLGDRVVLGAPVRRIVHEGRRVAVVTDEVTVRARRVIVAVPPPMTAAIAVDPPLPFRRVQLVQRMAGNTLMKCQAIYERPFWREDGLNGQAVADAGALRSSFDNSPPDGSRGVLMGFLGGSTARHWAARPQRERRAAVLRDLVTYFGPRAARPIAYVERIWMNEPWSRGAGAIAPPGMLLDLGPALRAPAGRIHWASAETSDYWYGYMEGAVRAGERAAAEALSEL